MLLENAEQSFMIAFLCAHGIGARDGNQGIADMEAFPRQSVHMDEIDDKALVAAHKQTGSKLCQDFIKPAVRAVFLSVLHMEAKDVIVAVYIGNVGMAEQDILSVGHDVQAFLRRRNMTGRLCQNFRQPGKAYGF